MKLASASVACGISGSHRVDTPPTSFLEVPILGEWILPWCRLPNAFPDIEESIERVERIER